MAAAAKRSPRCITGAAPSPGCRWILSDLNILVDSAVGRMNDYDIASVVNAAEGFIGRLSNWYVRRNRRRFWREKHPGDSDKLAAYQTLHEVLLTLCRLLCPIVPFRTETMYQNLNAAGKGPESVHLCTYPMADLNLIDRQLSERMEQVIALVSAVLGLRQSRSIRVRQPLNALHVACKTQNSFTGLKQFEQHLLEELNFKRLLLSAPGESSLETASTRFATVESEHWIATMDTLITEELLSEGVARDIVRHVQVLRKNTHLEISDRIILSYDTASETIAKAVEQWESYIRKQTLADAVKPGLKGEPGKIVRAAGGELSLSIEKVT